MTNLYSIDMIMDVFMRFISFNLVELGDRWFASTGLYLHDVTVL